MTVQEMRRFEQLWEQALGTISSSAHIDYEAPFEGECFLTAVTRLPPRLANPCIAAARAVVAGNADYYVYPASTVHFTHYYLTTLMEEAALAAHEFAVILDDFRGRVERMGPLLLRAAGLGMSASTIFVQLESVGFPCVMDYRETLRQSAETRGLDTSRLDVALPDVAIANLVRFRHPVGSGVVEEVRSRRLVVFGEFPVSEVELVTTDRLLRDEATTVHQVIQLGASEP